MIVISGALVLVALVLLIVGLVATHGVWLIYASIGVSLVAGVLLYVGTRARRNPVVAGGIGGGASPLPLPAAGVTLSEARTEPLEDTAVTTVRPGSRSTAGSSPAAAGLVFVVPDRPKYHAAGCRYLSGRDADTMALGAARAEGYVACGVCKPDEVAADLPVPEPVAVEPVAATARRAARAATTTTRQAQPRQTQPRQSQSRPAAPAAPPAARATTAKATKAAAAPAAVTRPRATVFVMPDRDKFHRESCRFVREGALEVAKATARRQGYEACGVCKP